MANIPNSIALMDVGTADLDGTDGDTAREAAEKYNLHYHEATTLASAGAYTAWEASPPKLGELAEYNGYLYVWDGAQAVRIETTTNTQLITSATHGFAVKEVIRSNGGSYAKAQADTEANSRAWGMIVEVPDVDNFRICTRGLVTGLSGLAAGPYWLSDSSAGAITDSEPTSPGDQKKLIGIALNATTMFVLNDPAITVLGDTLTSIGANTGTAVDKGIFFSAADVAAEYDLTESGRSMGGVNWTAGTQVPALTAADTASMLTVGTGNDNLVQLDGGAKLPAVDGSQLINLPATGLTSICWDWVNEDSEGLLPDVDQLSGNMDDALWEDAVTYGSDLSEVPALGLGGKGVLLTADDSATDANGMLIETVAGDFVYGCRFGWLIHNTGALANLTGSLHFCVVPGGQAVDSNDWYGAGFYISSATTWMTKDIVVSSGTFNGNEWNHLNNDLTVATAQTNTMLDVFIRRIGTDLDLFVSPPGQIPVKVYQFTSIGIVAGLVGIRQYKNGATIDAKAVVTGFARFTSVPGL